MSFLLSSSFLFSKFVAELCFNPLVVIGISFPLQLEKLPAAKMDENEGSISIPIRDYENYRNMVSLQDKQSIIRDLQHILNTKEQDLQRYREKCEQLESVLQRTQRALDKRMQLEHSQRSIPSRHSTSRPAIITLKRLDSKPAKLASNCPEEVVARAVGETTNVSLPAPAVRSDDTNSSLKSLPTSLGLGSPGMSSNLFKRLVQENLKLKAQLENSNAPSKSSKVHFNHLLSFTLISF